jgi:hypothetical protein
MNPLIRECPSCSRKVRVPIELLGKLVKCPSCGRTFQAESAAEVQSSMSSASAVTGLEPAPSGSTDSSNPSVTPPDQKKLLPCPGCKRGIPADANRCELCGAEIEVVDASGWQPGSTDHVRRDAEPHRGTTVLVLGILSILLPYVGLPLGILSLVLGRRDLVKMRKNDMDPEGQPVTLAGWICGIIGTIIQSFFCLGCIGYMVLVGALVHSVGPGNQFKNAAPPRPKQLSPAKPAQPPAKSPPAKEISFHGLPSEKTGRT